MKIEQTQQTRFHTNETNPEIQQKQNETKPDGKKFSKILQNKINEKTKVTPINNKNIENLFQDVEKMKIELENNPTIQNLKNYKECIKEYLNYYIEQDLKKEVKITRDLKGNTKRSILIKNIDDNLKQLTEKLILDNKQHIQLLHKLGEIQGLLVELYV